MVKEIICAVTNDLVNDQRMIRTCRTLSKAGYKVRLIGRELKFSKPLAEESYEQTRIKCWFNTGKLFYLEYNLRLLAEIRNTRAWAYVAVDLDTIIPMFRHAERTGAKKVYDAHEYFSEVPELLGRPLVKRIWEKIADRYVPQSDLAYTVGHNLADELSSRYGLTFQTIRNVPEWKWRELDDEEKKYTLIYQGALNVGRGLECIIDAMPKIKGKLAICGEGDLSEMLREKVIEMGLEERVVFLGKQNPDDLRRITRQALIGLNMLEAESLSYWYSLANKFFDYIQAGIPQICMAFPEYLLLSRRFQVAVLQSKLDADELAKSVNHLLGRPDRYEAMKKACVDAAKVLNWNAESARLLNLFHELETS